MSLASWTLSFLRPYRSRVVAIAVLSIAEIVWPRWRRGRSSSSSTTSSATIRCQDHSRLSWHPRAAASPVALLAIVVVAGLLLQIASEAIRMIHTQLQVDMGQRIVYNLRAQLLAHLQALPLRHHILTRTADSVYRLDADAHCVDDLVIGGVFPLALALLNLGVMFGVLVYLDHTLALLSLTVVPFLYLCLRHYSATMTDRAERVKALESTLIERAFEILSSVAAVKSFARERHELARFSRSGNETMRARLSLTWQESLFSVAVSAVTLAGTALVLVVGGLHVLDGRLTVGALLVVIAYLAAVYNPISAIAHTTGLAAAGRGKRPAGPRDPCARARAAGRCRCASTRLE